MKGPNKPAKAAWVREAVDRYERPLVRYAERLLGDLELARDVVQDTFIRLCDQDPAGLNGHEAQWLYTVCRNRALDVRRKERRMTPLGEIEVGACQGREPSPAAVVEGRQTAGQVLSLLAGLPANQQEVIRLKFQGGLSYRQISQVTKLTVSNVGFLIHTAIQNLREQLQAGSGPRPNAGRRPS